MSTTPKEKIEQITELLPLLSKTALHELKTFTDYLADREKRRKALVKRVLKAEKEHDSIVCNTVEEAMQAIFDAPDDDIVHLLDIGSHDEVY